MEGSELVVTEEDDFDYRKKSNKRTFHGFFCISELRCEEKIKKASEDFSFTAVNASVEMLMKEIKPAVTENCELYYLEKHIFSNFVKNSDYQSSDACFNIVRYQFYWHYWIVVIIRSLMQGSKFLHSN